MKTIERNDEPGAGQPAVEGDGSVTSADPPGDPVLASLDEARERYARTLVGWEEQRAELEQRARDADRLREAHRQLTEDYRRIEARLREDGARLARYRDRAKRLADELKNIHRSLFDGNVFSMILKSTLTITGATRGLYVTVQGDDVFRVRAAVDVDGYPQAPPSDFLKSLCLKVLGEQSTFICNGPDCEDLYAEPPPHSERFHNLIVAPVVLLHNLNGVVIIGDKLNGSFDHEDVETVLSVGDQAAVAVQNQRLQRELQYAYQAVVSVLADAVEAKDPYTSGHCELVSRLSKWTAQHLGLPEVERAAACFGGLLHDVGKIGVSDGILNKPGKLLPEEWELMRSHVRVGRDLLARVPILERVTDVILHHHEAYDGSGYPDGLKGDEISIAARIVCAVDAYCAMISKRSYKESYSAERARAELQRCRGKQFDPAVVDALLAVLDSPPAEPDAGEECGLPPGVVVSEDFRHVLGPPHVRAQAQPGTEPPDARRRG